MTINNDKMRFSISSLFCLFMIVCFSCSFSARKSLKYYRAVQDETFDIVVVPGVPLENDQWSRIMKARILWAKFLFDRGITKNIMFSGSAVYDPYIEGKVMAIYAKAIGIPEDRIYTETKAEHSTENIYYGYHKSRLLGFEKIALATDPFQSKQLKRFTRVKVDPAVALIPMVYDSLRTMQSDKVNPEVDLSSAKVENFESILDREGFFKRLKGTMGKNVDTTAYQKN